MSEHIYFIQVEHDDSLSHVLMRGAEDCLVDIGTITRKYINEPNHLACHFYPSNKAWPDHQGIHGLPGENLDDLKDKLLNHFDSWTERRIRRLK